MKFKMTENYGMYEYEELNIAPGLYYLVTANGNGKSTFLKNIARTEGFVELRRGISGKLTFERKLKEDDIVYFRYNAEDDNNRSRARTNDMNLSTESLVQAMMVDSEGQNRYRSFVDIVSDIGAAIKVNKEKRNKVIILLDAMDSGLDIAYCRKLREFFKDVVEEDIKNEDIWVFIAANQFALIKEQCCLDVNNGNILCFKEYEEYEKFIEQKAKEESQRVKKKSSRKRTCEEVKRHRF